MGFLDRRYALAASIFLLSGCIATDGVSSRSDSSGGGQSGDDYVTSMLLPLGDSYFEPREVNLNANTGTEIGRRVGEIHDDLRQVKASVAEANRELQSIRSSSVGNARTYHGSVSMIQSRLQVGTTRGNPELISEWQVAQRSLDDLARDVSAMNGLTSRIASDNGTAAFLLQTVRSTYDLPGAIERDHSNLSLLEDEVNRTVVLIDRLLNAVTDDLNRQTRYLNTERSNLQTLQVAISNGEFYGMSLANPAYSSAFAGGGGASAGEGQAASASSDRPLAVIRFDDADVAYEQAVHQVVREAMERRPASRFEVVAVSPPDDRPGTARIANRARRHAADVRQTLMRLGLEASRVQIASRASGDVSGPEVHLFVR
ncbi:hypothetical protein [Fodinicurvata sp. EGI_FJ10296]|uniref:hypothetical protein n=1 Tax=Fodinicurvata sp. EGI_FJ10296 TaxID=3231908 RepID=UPI0034511E19